MINLAFTSDRLSDLWTKSQPIDFADILAAVVTEVDPVAEAPWHDCDGWEHTFTPSYKLPDSLPIDDAKQSVGWVTTDSRRGGGGLITADLDVVKKDWMGEYSKFSGEHRQVYEERMAETRRNAVKQLVKWYENGWDAWGVVCEFMGEDDSLWGIYAEYADEYIELERISVAQTVARRLEEKGYTVINKPPPYNARLIKKNQKQYTIAHNLGFKDYEAYRRWVRTPCRWGDVLQHFMPRRGGWPRKNEVARIYRDKNKKSYFIVFVSSLMRNGNWDAVANVFGEVVPHLAGTSVSPAYISQNWLKRMAWDELPAEWRRAFRSDLTRDPANIRGFWRVGEQPGVER